VESAAAESAAAVESAAHSGTVESAAHSGTVETTHAAMHSAA
jgi:hypothetical protein